MVALGCGALEVEGEEAFEDLLIGEVVGPAVGVKDGAVELLVGELEPGGLDYRGTTEEI